MTTIVSIAQGGTGANNAAAARNTLGAAANTGGVFTGAINVATANITTIETGNTLTLSTGTASNGNIIFSANGAEDMRITTAGRVGIGTTIPPYILSAETGTATQLYLRGGSTGFTHASILLSSNTADSPQSRGLGTYMFNEGTDSTWYMGTFYNAGNTWGVGVAGGTTFQPQTADSANIRLSVANTGNVGISILSPTSNLHVVGNANVTTGINTATLNATTVNVTSTLGGGSTLTIQPNVTISQSLTVTGNLIVSGSSTTLNTEILIVEDADIVLLSNVTGTPALNSGITVNRGTSTNTFLRWSEDGDRWGWTDDGTTFYSFDNVRSGLVTTNTTFATINTTTATMNTATTNRVLKAGDTMTGNLIVSGATINTATANITTIITGNTLTLSTGTGSNSNVVISANGTEYVRVTNTGFVGIGTTNPTARLEVQGGMRAGPSGNANTFQVGTESDGIVRLGPNIIFPEVGAGRLNIQDRLSAFISFYVSNTLTSRIKTGEAGFTNYLVFEVSGSDRLTITNTGSIGIGTTSPAERLHVSGTIQIDGSTSGIRMFKNGSSSIASHLYIANAANDRAYNWQLNSDGSALDFWAYNGSSWNNRITYTASGNVGIGTTNPSQRLEVAGNIFVNTSGNPFLELKTSGAGNNPYLRLTAATNYWDFQGTFSNANDELYLMYNGNPRMVITSDGNVGIGTTAPVGTLQVTGAGSRTLSLASPASGGGSASYIIMGNNDSGGTTGPNVIVAANRALIIGHGTSFSSSTGGTVTGQLIVTSNGETIIGNDETTAISTDRLHSIGQIGGRASLAAGAYARLVMQERTSNWISFVNGSGTHFGTISVSGAGVSYGSNSDYRLKENIIELTNAISRVKQLKPKRFNFINEPEITQDGFLAHEVQDVVPEAVVGDKDGYIASGNVIDAEGNIVQFNVAQPKELESGMQWIKLKEDPKYQTLDTSYLVPLLTKALQEAIEKIEILENKVAALELGNN